MSKKELLHTQKMPKHVAIIMDGNGRWAKQKGRLRVFGHENGTKSVREITETCVELNIENLTLYAFSTENWKRPKIEVQTLMRLLISSLKNEIKTLQDNDIRLQTIGNTDELPRKVQRELQDVISQTKGNKKMTLTLALSYGSRDEIINTIKQISIKVKNNIISPELIFRFPQATTIDGLTPWFGLISCMLRGPYLGKVITGIRNVRKTTYRDPPNLACVSCVSCIPFVYYNHASSIARSRISLSLLNRAVYFLLLISFSFLRASL